MKDYQYSFEKLHVWADIRQMIKFVYDITSKYPDSERFGLAGQMRRAAISVGPNLAEGSSRTSAKDQSHYYQLAFSSVMELLSQTVVSIDLGFITEDQSHELRDQIHGIAYKLNSLRRESLKRVK
jgi:four helix bundle protein